MKYVAIILLWSGWAFIDYVELWSFEFYGRILMIVGIAAIADYIVEHRKPKPPNQ